MEEYKVFTMLKLAVLSMVEKGELVDEELIDRMFIAEQLTADMIMDEAGFNMPDIPLGMSIAVLYLLCGVAKNEIENTVIMGGIKNEGRVDKKYRRCC